MTPTTEQAVYLCCFCGNPIRAPEDGNWNLTLQGEPAGGSQDLFAHPRCLRAHVHPSVPLLSDG